MFWYHLDVLFILFFIAKAKLRPAEQSAPLPKSLPAQDIQQIIATTTHLESNQVAANPLESIDFEVLKDTIWKIILDHLLCMFFLCPLLFIWLITCTFHSSWQSCRGNSTSQGFCYCCWWKMKKRMIMMNQATPTKDQPTKQKIDKNSSHPCLAPQCFKFINSPTTT